MTNSRLKALLLVPVLSLLMAAAVLVDPAPISVPSGLTEKAVEKSIVIGVAQRGWIVTKQEPGYMEATLNIRTHMARVGIRYDLSAIQIKYLDSTNLDYEVDGNERHIHRNYAKWVNNIVHDISVQLQTAALSQPGT